MEELTQIDDNAVVFKREGTYQARIRLANSGSRKDAL